MTFQPLIPTVLTPVAVPVLPDPAPAILAVAEALQPDLAQGFQIDALRLRLEMERAFGGSDAMAPGTGSSPMRRARWRLSSSCGNSAARCWPGLARLLHCCRSSPRWRASCPRIPGARRRWSASSNSRRRCPWGLRPWRPRRSRPRDLVLEPSAGTGLLAILAEIAGGSLALNELADTRADLLRLLFPGRPVTRFDAAQIDDHLDAGVRPSVILMNPPFSAVANVDGRTTEATARHLRSALARLAPGGRLVAITGAGFAPDAPAWAETFDRLTESAHLVFTGAVSGAAFAKHGTSFRDADFGLRQMPWWRDGWRHR